MSLTLSYNNTAHVHAETNAGSNSYAYAADGNPSATLRAGMTSRTVAGGTFTLGYDAEGRMVSASGPSLTASFGFCPQGESLRA